MAPLDQDIINLTLNPENQIIIMPTETAKKNSGRRRRSNESKNKKKQKPQRGMGVAKLEQLRSMQHQFPCNKINPVNLQSPAYQEIMNYSSSPSVHYFPRTMGLNPTFLVHQRAVNDQYYQNQMGLYANKEPSSTPSNYLMSNINSWLCGCCRVCNKKKRMINGENFGTRRESHDIDHVEKIMGRRDQDFGNIVSKASFRPQSALRSIEKEVEAIYKKGSSSSSVVKEYEFFPDSNSYNSEKAEVMMSSNLSASSSVAALEGGEATSFVTTSSNSSIDLSLNLSCN